MVELLSKNPSVPLLISNLAPRPHPIEQVPGRLPSNSITKITLQPDGSGHSGDRG
jgi:hypothetical protein